MSVRELITINRRIRESDSYKRVHRVDDLKPSVNIFIGNHRELMTCLVACEKDWKILDIRRRQDVTDLLNETSRALHNFAASSMGLVDHARIFVRESMPEKGVSEFVEKEISRLFVNDGLSQFIKHLRHFMMHCGIPDVVLTEGYDSSKGDYQIIGMRKSDLLVYSGWNVLAKAYIMKFEDEVLLTPTVDEYFQKVMAFQQWLRDRAFEYYKEDFAILEAMEEGAKPHRRNFVVSRLESILREVEPSRRDPFDELANDIQPEQYRFLAQEKHPSLRIQRAILYLEVEHSFSLPADLKGRLVRLGDELSAKALG